MRTKRQPKRTIELLALDVRDLQRQQMLKPGLSIICKWPGSYGERGAIRLLVEEGQVVLDYVAVMQDVTQNPVKKTVGLTWTDCGPERGPL